MATGTLSNIQTGSRKLLGKSNPINSLQVHDGLIYSASTAIDGAGVKVYILENWNNHSYFLTIGLQHECIYAGWRLYTASIESSLHCHKYSDVLMLLHQSNKNSTQL